VLVGQVGWVDPNNSQSDKKAGAINVTLTGATANNRGAAMIIYTRSDASSAGLSERMRIDQSGNVGIGTAAPGCVLDAFGMIRSTSVGPIPSSGIGVEIIWNSGMGCGNLTAYDRGGSTFQPLRINGSTLTLNTQSVGAVAVGNDLSVPPFTSSDPNLVVGGTVSGIGRLTLAGNVTGTANAVGSLAFANYAVTAADKRVAAINGNTDGATSSASLTFLTWSAGVSGERMRITSAGTVGIGTIGPQTTLHVLGPSGDPAGTYGSAVISGGDLAHQIRIGYNTTGGYGWIQAVQDGVAQKPLVLQGAGGNLGIGGTSGPVASLHVASSAAAGGPATAGTTDTAIATRLHSLTVGTVLDFGTNGSGVCWMQNRANTNLATNYPLALNPNGNNVGIGNINPGYKLDVTGDCNITGTYRVNGTPLATGGGLTTTTGDIHGSRAMNTVYQNTSGKAMWVSVTLFVNNASCSLMSDASNPPATVVANGFQAAGGAAMWLGMWVLPGHYYKAVGTASISYWIEYT
jgi:hypothetical protein